MNRIDTLFNKKSNHIASIYLTAGFPALKDTIPNIIALEKQGVDMIEIGIPFSDPLADGGTIQQASKKALDNGMSLQLLMDQLKGIREQVSIPLILMGYWNVIYQYGVKKFCKQCQETGIDGLIIPDLPLAEYKNDYKVVFDTYELYNILLITPTTTDERMKHITEVSQGFIYVVSTPATTGNKLEIGETQKNYFQKTQKLGIPTLIGFGVHDRASFREACKYANGAIVGSAYIKALEESREEDFVKNLIHMD